MIRRPRNLEKREEILHVVEPIAAESASEREEMKAAKAKMEAAKQAKDAADAVWEAVCIEFGKASEKLQGFENLPSLLRLS